MICLTEMGYTLMFITLGAFICLSMSVKEGSIMNEDRFAKAVEVVLKHEGGYANNPRDPGGETKFGISARSNPDVDIRGLTRQQAIHIYKERYWRDEYEIIRDEKLAVKIFDLAVNMGHGKAHMLLQEAVNELRDEGQKLTVDGYIGPKTLEALNSADLDEVYGLFIRQVEDFYLSIGKPEFVAGWLNRLYDGLA